MEQKEQIYLSLAPELKAFLTDNGISVTELLKTAKVPAEVIYGEDPATPGSGHKEPATIILASAAAIAVATPLLRELIRNISGRTPVIRERKLVQTTEPNGQPSIDKDGRPVMAWHEIERANVVGDKVRVKGFGIEIAFESN
ncbi:MAG: hypothetical protein BVN33_06155 [Proteobacteria bacterium ST_bin13]|nr:MAG: hypothetical protein BVN33_06155 [Proteobacteria bacterium ST_bin13]